jgi:hypothetical protein
MIILMYNIYLILKFLGGYLSIRVTDLFNSIEGIFCLVLSPCCMPSARKRAKDMKQRRNNFSGLQNSSVFNYEVWCLNICFTINTSSGHILRSRYLAKDSWVLSEKSTYIAARRNAREYL